MRDYWVRGIEYMINKVHARKINVVQTYENTKVNKHTQFQVGIWLQPYMSS